MMRYYPGILLLAACCASAQTAIYKDKFLRTSNAGDLAWVPEAVDSISKSKTVVPLARNGTEGIKRRAACIVAIAHRDAEQKNTETFVGIQLLKVFTKHATPGVIHVIRDSPWYDRISGKPLPSERHEVGAKSTAEFAAAHASPVSLQSLLFANGRENIANAWHARLGSAKDAPYSAEEQYVKFWRSDPLTDRLLLDAHPQAFENEPAIRVENRLLRFTLTDSTNPSRLPSFSFDCKDPSLALVAIKIYLPFASDAAWTYLKFE